MEITLSERLEDWLRIIIDGLRGMLFIWFSLLGAGAIGGYIAGIVWAIRTAHYILAGGLAFCGISIVGFILGVVL